MRAQPSARLTAVLLGVSCFVVVACSGTTPDPAATEGAAVALVDARLIDGDGSVIAERGVLISQDGRITAVGAVDDVTVPAGATRVDVAGRTIVPGFVNAHAHLANTSGLDTGPEHYTDENLRRQLDLYSSYGVTTVMSLGGDADAGFALRDGSRSAMLDRARLLVAGPVVASATVDDARADIDRVAAMEPDIIKIRVDDNLGSTTKMPLPVATAVIDQARSHGLRVAAHIFYLDDAKALLDAGVGLVAHSVRDQAVDDDLIAAFRDTGVCYVPTLTREVSTFVYESEPEFFADPFFLRSADPEVLTALRDPERQARMRESASAQQYKVALEVASENLARLASAGVPIAFGTDTGPPARFQGYFEHLELEMMREAGMSPTAVVAAATGASATCLGLDDRGYLRPGQLADFVVLGQNPLDDILATRSIESVWVGGRRLGESLPVR